jgi:hypothetical protein
MVLRRMARSPRRRIRLATVAGELMARTPGWAAADLRRLDTSNGCQDHTLLPSASAPFVLRAWIAHGTTRPAIACARDAAASTASHTNVRDDREPPLFSGWDGLSCRFDLGLRQSDLFFSRRLDRNSRTLPVGQITRRKKRKKSLRRSVSCLSPASACEQWGGVS